MSTTTTTTATPIGHLPTTRSFLAPDVAAGFEPWKMNLTAISERDPARVYVAVRDAIRVYHLNPISLACKGPALAVLRGPLVRDRNQVPLQADINQIKVGFLGNAEVLVAADDLGRALIWYTDTLDTTPTPTILTLPASAWGIAIHASLHIVAITCNAHTVTVYDLRTPAARRASPVLLDKATQYLDVGHEPQISRTLVGHHSNVPGVVIHSSGKWAASVSIDHTCRIWRLSTGACVGVVDLQQWGWQVCFLPDVGTDLVVVCATVNGVVACRIPEPSSQPLPAPTTARLTTVFAQRPTARHLSHFTRLSMIHLLPELGLVALGSQDGRIALIRVSPSSPAVMDDQLGDDDGSSGWETDSELDVATPATAADHGATLQIDLVTTFPARGSTDEAQAPMYGMLVMRRSVMDPWDVGEPWSGTAYRIANVLLDGSARWADVGPFLPVVSAVSASSAPEY
ncbi:WD40-repeat-containing domain protein [Blastocladiella britannica]|nr:WD40-repeat-containing domain protein [Blastocladiella britannica]